MPTSLKLTQAETALGKALPHRRDEAWKWTDVRGYVNATSGGLTKKGVPQFTLPSGVSVREDDTAPTPGVMSALASHLSPQAYIIDVAKDAKPDAPLSIDALTHGHIRMVVNIAAGARLHMVEHHRAAEGAFANIDLQVNLGRGAKHVRTLVHNDAPSAARIATAHISMDEGARLEQFSLSFGAGLSRLETTVHGQGADISALINGAYLLNGDRHMDMTSHIHLKQPSAHIRQSVKGVVTDKSRGVFQGKFLVDRLAQLADAEMRHDALMLSERSEIRSKPELEIYADDVACAHGNTIGQLDESALFYMRRRGIPDAKARAMLTHAFIASVFDDLEDEALKDSILEQAAQWLEA